MKVVFAHDHIFTEANGCVFSSGSFPKYVWSRYLKIADQLVVVGRYGGVVSGKHGFVVSSRSGVAFEFFPNLSTFRSFILGNKLAKILCKRIVEDSDAVIARLPSRIGEFFVREAIRQKKPYALEVVGDPFEALKNHGTWKGKVYASFASASLRKVVKNSPYTIYVTENYLQERYPTLGGVTEFCSNVSIDPVDSSCLHRRIKRIRSSNKNTVLGLIGNFSAAYKGIDVALRALEQILEFYPDCEFQIVGKGNPLSYIKLSEALGVRDNVKFIGSLEAGSAIFDWLEGVDIYLQPSLTEGLPRALIEAMSRGCPAIASNVGGIPELLPGSEMVRPGDHQELAKRLMNLIKDRDKQCSLARQNFEKAQEYYADIIEERRSVFWLGFREYVAESRC